MRMLLVPLAGVGFAALVAQMAPAAPPAYCALYAREFANQLDATTPAQTAVRIQDQAYYRCLNQDDEPPMPTTSAYMGGDMPAMVLSDEPTASIHPAGNGPAGWSAERVSKCRQYYPNSFDAETGTVLPYEASSREMCPF